MEINRNGRGCPRRTLPFNRSRTQWVPAILQAGSLEHFACSSNSSHPSRPRTCTGAVPAEA
jgi:hypothetical protein